MRSARPEVDPRRIGAVGYCLGGLMALELARTGAALAAVVGVHSPVSTTRQSLRGPDEQTGKATPAAATWPAPRTDTTSRIRGQVLILNGADDPTVPRAQYEVFDQEMRAGGVNWQLHLFGGTVHSFTTPDAAEFGNTDVLHYDPRSRA